MKQFINSICNSNINRNQTMKYLLTMAMFFALSASVLAEGGARVIEYTYSHRIKFVDPSNNPNDPLGINNPVVGVNIQGGADCVPGIANCVGGSNAVGSVDSVYYVNGSPVTVQSVNQYQRVKMGKYYNPNDMSKTDKTFSGLVSLTFTLTKNGNQVWSTTINYSDITNNSASPFSFNQFDALTGGTWLGEGSIFKDNDGAIHFTSAPLITSTLDENADFLLTVTPTASSATVNTSPLTRIYLGETLVSQAPKTGETKYSSNSANHEGWYLMNGALVSNIGNVNARAAATILFGSGGVIPNMDGLYTVATTSATPYTLVGDTDNQITVDNTNIHSATLTAASNGAHSHSFQVHGLDDGNFSGGNVAGDATNFKNWQSTTTEGNHTHNVALGVANPTGISIQPYSAQLYQFVYLGQ